MKKIENEKEYIVVFKNHVIMGASARDRYDAGEYSREELIKCIESVEGSDIAYVFRKTDDIPINYKIQIGDEEEICERKKLKFPRWKKVD